MFCKKCGTRIEEGGKFCPNCGEQVQPPVMGQGYTQGGGQGNVNVPGGRPGGPVYRGPQENSQYSGPAGGPYSNRPPEYGEGRPGGDPGRGPYGQSNAQPPGKGPGKNTGLVVILSILIVLLIVSIAAGIFLIVKNSNESAPAEKQVSEHLETKGSKPTEKGGISAETEKASEGRAQTENGKQAEHAGKAQTQAGKPQQTEQKQSEQKQTEQKQTETQQTKTQKESETASQTETEKTVHTYTLIKGDYTWSEALKYCQEHGGYLASVTSEEEQKLAEAEIAKDPTVKVVWLGAENLSTGGTFKWSNGDGFTYSKWGVGEPNNDQGLEHYLVMYYVDDEWVWNDAPDDVSQYYAGKIGFLMETEQPGN